VVPFFSLNRIPPAGGMNPGLKALWEDERERRRQLDCEEGSLTPPDSPPRPAAAHAPTDSERFWFQRYDAMIAEKRLGRVTQRLKVFYFGTVLHHWSRNNRSPNEIVCRNTYRYRNCFNCYRYFSCQIFIFL
jgi:hypothetical protein